MMSVYSNIFDMIRREEHILENNEQKAKEYQDLKKILLASIGEIKWNKKDYPIRVQQNVHEIIAEIKAATSAKIVAAKLYQLHKITITESHSLHDKQHLEACMSLFTKRIAQMM